MNEEALLDLTHDRLTEDEFTEILVGNNFYLTPKPNFLSLTEILYKVFCTSN